jgi:pimeloyl-ACP methyl ester carboxylesterase
MFRAKRLLRTFYRLLLPIVILVVAATVTASVWLVQKTSRPQSADYLVTPDKYGLLSSRGAQVTDEKWSNKDGTSARGWLLRGSQGAPAVILLHKYGADRSYELNLGVKLNEATNFTILMPDMRGHGPQPLVQITSFGGAESDDVLAAVQFLRALKTQDQLPLVSQNIGVYGVELGALAALEAAVKDKSLTSLALDSVPQDSNALLASAVGRRYPFASFVTSEFARLGTNLYYLDGSYTRSTSCEAGRAISDRRVMLLAGVDASDFQSSTLRLSKCIQGSAAVETKVDLSPSGYSIMSASLEQSGAYDQRVIDFFRATLPAPAG